MKRGERNMQEIEIENHKEECKCKILEKLGREEE